jgi:hypothetical protein
MTDFVQKKQNKFGWGCRFLIAVTSLRLSLIDIVLDLYLDTCLLYMYIYKK